MGSESEALKTEAERAVRRGELLDAVGLYQQVLEVNPDDAAAAARLKALSEQVSSADGSGAPHRRSSPPLAQTAEQRAERLLEQGDPRGALAIYAEILRIRPDHQLAAERKQEIEVSLMANESAEPGANAERQPDPAQPARGKPDREEFLTELLTRITRRRRPSRAFISTA